MFSIKRWMTWQLKFLFFKFTKKVYFKANWRSTVIDSNIGKYCDVGSSNLNLVNLGNYSYINSGKCHMANIGKFCSIGQSVRIGSFGSHPQNISTHPSFFHPNPQIGISFYVDNTHKDYAPIEIGNDVWIGDNVSIIDGVKIGTGSIIGAGAVVTKDIPPYSIAAGVPAKIIRKRFEEEMIELLLKTKWWDLSYKNLLKLGPSIGSTNTQEFLDKKKVFEDNASNNKSNSY